MHIAGENSLGQLESSLVLKWIVSKAHVHLNHYLRFHSNLDPARSEQYQLIHRWSVWLRSVCTQCKFITSLTIQLLTSECLYITLASQWCACYIK